MTDENTRLPSDSVVEAAYREGYSDADNSYTLQYNWEWSDARRAALAAQPRDDVLDRYQEALRTIQQVVEDASYCVKTDTPYSPFIKALNEVHAITEAALSQTDEQPDIPDMTDAECATAYRDLRKRANDAGFATVGEWIDEQPDTDGLSGELERLIAEATPGDLSSAEVHEDSGTLECPLCHGDGEVEQDGHYNNFDGLALGVQFYGIGKHFGAHERLWTWLMQHRSTILTALRTDRKAVLEEAAKDENAVTEYRVYSGSGHNGPKRFDNLADAVADAKIKAAVPSYMGPPGTMTPVQLIKHTVITEEIRFRALAEGAGK